jgi:hypothetical protein
MASLFSVLSTAYLSREEVTLGRLVLNLREPGQDFCPSVRVSLQKSDVSEAPFGGIELFLQKERSVGLLASFTKLLSFNAASTSKSAEHVTSTLATTYKILNSGQFFERIMDDGATQRWLENYVYKKRTAYMVVGLITVLDPKVKADGTTTGEISASADVPLGETVAPGSSLVPVGESLDIELRVHAQAARTENAKFMAPGDRIIGVQYRKLRLRGLKKKQVTSAVLAEKAHWETYLGDQKPRGPNNEPAEIIEVAFDESAPDEDLEESNEAFRHYHFEGESDDDFILLVWLQFSVI